MEAVALLSYMAKPYIFMLYLIVYHTKYLYGSKETREGFFFPSQK